MRKKLLISFSGGETSAYMAQWLWNHKQDEFQMKFVFANTGQENEQTLEFVEKCSTHFGFPVVWIEAVTDPRNGVGQSFKIVEFETASRDGEPFEAVIAKHGIPNMKTPHCTRDLKERPINKYAKSIGWNDCKIAIGIRADEFDRINLNDDRLIYPLITMREMTKPKINFWWNQQPFRLELKGYQGNCKWCWKKSDKKLLKIASENKDAFEFPARMEKKYQMYVPESRLKRMQERGEKPNLPVMFFRGNKSVKDILDLAKDFTGNVVDDSIKYTYQTSLFETDLVGSESCEIFSECKS